MKNLLSSMLSLSVITGLFCTTTVHCRAEEGQVQEISPVKLSNPSLLDAHEGKVVSTTAVLKSLTSPGMMVPDDYEDFVQFSLTDENQTVLVGGLIEQSSSDIIFGQEVGAELKMTGKVVATRFPGGLAHVWLVVLPKH